MQLFAHLEGEALNVAFLMLERECANRKGLSQGLSNYYNSPGRLAVFRRKFESVNRQTGADPAMFAMELEILAVRDLGIWVHAPGTGWSRTDLLWTNVVVDCGATLTVSLRIRRSGR